MPSARHQFFGVTCNRRVPCLIRFATSLSHDQTVFLDAVAPEKNIFCVHDLRAYKIPSKRVFLVYFRGVSKTAIKRRTTTRLSPVSGHCFLVDIMGKIVLKSRRKGSVVDKNPRRIGLQKKNAVKKQHKLLPPQYVQLKKMIMKLSTSYCWSAKNSTG